MDENVNGEKMNQASGIRQLIARLPKISGVNEAVVLGGGGEILFYHSQRPLLKNSVPFIVNKSRQVGALFGFDGFRYAAMQRGKGRKMVVMATNNLMVGLEVDARCLQQVLLDKLQPLLEQADKEM